MNYQLQHNFFALPSETGGRLAGFDENGDRPMGPARPNTKRGH